MSIARMSKIEIVVPRPEGMKLITFMQNHGSLQLEEVPLVVQGVRSFLHREQLSTDQLSQKNKYADILKTLSGMTPIWKNLPYPQPAALKTARENLSSEDAGYLSLLVSRMKKKSDTLLRKRANIARDMKALEKYRKRLDQLSDIFETSRFSESMKHIALLITPGDTVELERIRQQLADATSDNSHVFASHPGQKRSGDADVALLAFPEEYEAQVKPIIRNSSISELRLPNEVRNLPLKEAVSTLQDILRNLPERLGEIDRKIKTFQSDNHAMSIVVDQVSSDTLNRLNAMESIAHSRMLTIVHAWIPSEQLAGFETQLRDEIGDCVAIAELQNVVSETNTVPVRLKNASIVRPFERLLQLFSVPLYGSFDPTLLMALVFPLFFGLILGDFAYGLILLGLVTWAKRRWKHNPVFRDITTIGIWCACSSIIFGLVFGEFLGDLGHRIGMIPIKAGGLTLIPIWKSRELVIHELLMITVIIGFCHITLGLVLGMVESIRMKAWHHLGERTGLLMGLLGLLLFMLPIDAGIISESIRKNTAIIIIVTAAVVLIRYSGVAGPIEIISLAANVLSYCRLMALGIAGMVLANLANQLAAGHSNMFIGILIAIPFHILAVILGILEPTIHALRLHYVEFLPKFFIGDGRVYTPLQRKDTHYGE